MKPKPQEANVQKGKIRDRSESSEEEGLEVIAWCKQCGGTYCIDPLCKHKEKAERLVGVCDAIGNFSLGRHRGRDVAMIIDHELYDMNRRMYDRTDVSISRRWAMGDRDPKRVTCRRCVTSSGKP